MDWLTQLLGSDPAQAFASTGVPPPLGQSLQPMGVDAGMADPSSFGAPGGAAGGRSPLADALRGVPAQARPAAPVLGTPSAPQAKPVQGGELMQLMMLLNGGMQKPPAAPQLPGTLGQALGGR